MTKPHDDFKTYQEYRDGMEALANTQGFQLGQKYDRLGMSFYIFKRNHDELISSIEHFKQPRVMLLWDDEEIGQFLNEVTRRLHNFVAAAKTLVEHTRIITRELYGDTEFWKEYDAEVTQRFTLNPAVQFVHKLRDYILHRDLPVTSARLSLTDFDSSLLISIEKMRDWDSWTGLSRQYVNTAKDQEKIEDIVRAYTESVISFHSWFYDRHVELHEEAYAETERLRQRLINSRWHLKTR